MGHITGRHCPIFNLKISDQNQNHKSKFDSRMIGLVKIIWFTLNLVAKCLKIICDIIKGNESDVGNTDFELQAKKGDKVLCFTFF